MNNGYTPTARSTDPQTSHDAAQAQQGATVYDQVLAVIQTAGSKGCTLDDLAAALPWHEKISISPVPARLKEQGIVYETGTTRTGKSGRQQIVHVAYLPGKQVSIPAIVQRARQHTTKDPTPAPSVDALIAASQRVTDAFRALGTAYGIMDEFRAKQECEFAMEALDATLANCKPEGGSNG